VESGRWSPSTRPHRRPLVREAGVPVHYFAGFCACFPREDRGTRSPTRPSSITRRIDGSIDSWTGSLAQGPPRNRAEVLTEAPRKKADFWHLHNRSNLPELGAGGATQPQERMTDRHVKKTLQTRTGETRRSLNKERCRSDSYVRLRIFNAPTPSPLRESNCVQEHSSWCGTTSGSPRPPPDGIRKLSCDSARCPPAASSRDVAPARSRRPRAVGSTTFEGSHRTVPSGESPGSSSIRRRAWRTRRR
jgi:hypothetical protein